MWTNTMGNTAAPLPGTAQVPAEQRSPALYIGLMSGTSMDGVDGVLAEFASAQPPRVLAHVSTDFPAELREALFALQSSGSNELERAALSANRLVECYAHCCTELLTQVGLSAKQITAIGAHGQTVRHRPELGYTWQINNPARLAEQVGIDVVGDFRSRDVAAGGQGAPLAPGFHAQIFGSTDETRVICNLGGIANLTILPADPTLPVRGFDCGPANALLDHWAFRHTGQRFDLDGRFAAQGQVNPGLLAALMADPFFTLAPPKSTGRDLFNEAWLGAILSSFAGLASADVQATLVAFTAASVAQDVVRHAPSCRTVFVCGGGASNPILMSALARALLDLGMTQVRLTTTAELGVPPQQVEALAFAWLAHRCLAGHTGNLAAVTGAAGARILGAIYPA